MSTNSRWTDVEQMKVVWKIVDSELISKTLKGSAARRQEIEKIVIVLEQDPDFSARQSTDNPKGTIAQHVRVWINHLENGDNRPPLTVRLMP